MKKGQLTNKKHKLQLPLHLSITLSCANWLAQSALLDKTAAKGGGKVTQHSVRIKQFFPAWSKSKKPSPWHGDSSAFRPLRFDDVPENLPPANLGAYVDGPTQTPAVLRSII